MRRREFIALLAGSAVTWPVPAWAQDAGRKRAVGILMTIAESDPDGPAAVGAFKAGLKELGWVEGRDVEFAVRWGAGAAEAEKFDKLAAQLVALKPDIVLAVGAVSVRALRNVDPALPIVFIVVPDPVGAGFVDSLARPGGEITGFGSFPESIGSKWVQLLSQVVPGLTRILVLSSADKISSEYYGPTIRASAATLKIDTSAVTAAAASDIESAVSAFLREGPGALIVLPDQFTVSNSDAIVRLAMQHRMPGVYPYETFAESGGLMFYGIDRLDIFGRAASYVDRILKGQKPGELPVQYPTKFDLMINLKSAKTLGVTIPSGLLASADQAIE